MDRRQLLAALPAAAMAPAAFAQAPTFPRGAVIRTILRDYAPEELAGGATLFHEHMSLRPGFLNDWNRFSGETRAANAPPGGAGRGGGAAGRGGAAAAPATPGRGGVGQGAIGGAVAASVAAATAGRGGAAPQAAPGRAGGAATPAAPGRAGGAATTRTSTDFLSEDAFMIEEMTTAKNEGIGCLVDGGHPDMGRDPAFLRRISQASGLPIVCSAGFYTQVFYPRELSNWTEDQVYQQIMTQVRANPTGALGEIGSWDYITKDERKVFRAIGRVQRETGLPIFTHTGIPGKSALEQLDILEDAGADVRKIVIGHLGNLNDANTEIHRAVIRRGAFIGFDRQGGNGDATVVPMVKSLCDMGYSDNLMFSSDLSSERETKRGGGGGYAKTLTVFAPKVIAAGVSQEIVHKIMYDNPRRWAAFVPKLPR